MCGFIGTFSKNNIDQKGIEEANNYLICRGPDHKNVYSGNLNDKFGMKNTLNFSFIFNRLSIIDLSDTANQPMISNIFNTTLMFNGEIYNHENLRKELEAEGVKFFTDHSDTEVVLNGLSTQGPSFVKKLIGQFSIVFLDHNLEKVYLIRDRLGQKPLFYFIDNNNISFSSNLKSLIRLNNKFDLDNDSIDEFLNLGVVTSPNTIFKNHQKVEPGQLIEIDLKENFNKKTQYYWKLEDSYGTNKFDSDVFYNLLFDSIKMRNVSDVPIANFLSGGIDSSLIVMFQSLIQSKPNTFSIGYEDIKYDESKWSNLVSEKYSTNHDLMFINIDDLKNLVDDSLDIFDEPYADPSVLPSYSISKLISQNYKVAISGDGGDELSGGYLRTHQTLKSGNFNHAILKIVYDMYPSYLGSGVNILKNSNNKTAAYSTYFEDRKLLNLLNIKQNNNFTEKFITSDFTNYKNLMFTEYKFYLAEQMMLKVDRTSMASSLEVRSPFVDHRIVEYLFSTDEKDYISKEPKFILKRLLTDDFDSKFLNREKMGFVFNVEDYIKNNITNIEKSLFNGLDIFQKNSKQIKKLSTFHSRTNALRLWKMFTLQKFVNSFK
ncbi:asparagine synthase (glutamine-hydrolyzing) [Acidimicrobiaceae bacterium]|nr:asparagine synthase (glutamine-hydrolyzing) [Acidimicrobiaceae bacterium]